MKHEKCRRACTKAMTTLRNLYMKGTRIEITIKFLFRRFLSDGTKETPRFQATNTYGHIWTGSACCKWRARAKAAKVLKERRKK